MQFPKDFVEQEGIFQPIDSANAIAYTDGAAAEHYLDSVLSTAADLDSLSAELRDRIRDWPSRYHLSAERSNLLRCLDLQAGARVLEIGAGCGALTRYLGEHAGAVFALEGNPTRARLCRKRCRGLDNVTVVAGDVFKLQLDDLFDIVTLIGVLEYAGSFCRDAPDPFRALLALAARWLRPGGQLVLAIENQFGIKYFSGCGEDHGEPHFAGIEGYPDATGVRTFGRAELSALLGEVGLRSTALILPFPDYKIPNSFIHADYADAEGAKRFGLADWCRKPFDDYARERLYLFDDHLALQELARNGLLPELANSFLIVATKPGPERAVCPIGPSDWIAQRYNVTRHPLFRTKTTLKLEGGHPTIGKQRLTTSASGGPDANPSKVHHVLDADPFVEGAETMALAMVRALRRRQAAEDAFASLLQQWIGFFKPEHAVNGDMTRVRGEFVDCIPDNLVNAGGPHWIYVDREWRWNAPIALDWIVYRGLVSLWCHHRLAIAGRDSRQFGTMDRFIARCFELLGSPTTASEFEALRAQEEEFQAIVRSGSAAAAAVALHRTKLSDADLHGWRIPGRTGP